MPPRKLKMIAVDKSFFDNEFEVKRKQMQKKLGLTNLSQPKFTQMILEIRLKPLKNNFKNSLTNSKLKGRKSSRGKNDFFKI